MSASAKKKLRKEAEALQLTEKQLQEKKEAKKLKIYTTIFVAIMVAVLLVGVISWAVQGVKKSGLIEKYTTALKVNGDKISSAELNYYYVDAIQQSYNSWYEQFQDNTVEVVKNYFMLDLSKPLNEQFYDVNQTMTWAEYFANLAVDDATTVHVLCDAAEKEGFKLSDDQIASIDSNLNFQAAYTVALGAPDYESYLKSVYGNGASEKGYRDYVLETALAQEYSNHHSESLSYTDTDIRSYDEKHFYEFSAFSFSSFYMPVSKFYEGGTKQEDGTTVYSDAEKKAAADAAAAAAETIKNANPTSTEELNAAIAKLSVYAESAGVASENKNESYENITTEIRDWLCEGGRKAGDFAVLPANSTSTDADGKEVTTILGYYFVLNSGREDNQSNMISVRHILKQFEGGTSKNGTTLYTEEEKLTAKNAIDKVYEEWQAGEKTEEAFGKLADSNSDDPGSNTNGGLYENVFPGAMVENFNDWCFDESRKPGDVEIIETEFGYHLMYFVKTQDMTARDYMIQETLRSNEMETWYQALLDSADVNSASIKHLDLDYVAVK